MLCFATDYVEKPFNSIDLFVMPLFFPQQLVKQTLDSMTSNVVVRWKG